MKKIKYIMAAILLLVFSACQKEITLNVNGDHQSQLFIEGIIFADENPKIYVSKSFSFFNEKVSPQQVFERNLDISISVDNSKYTLEVDSTFDKFRCRWNLFYTMDRKIERDKKYRLELWYNNKLITAETSTNLKPVTIKEVEYTAEFFDIYGGHDGVIVRFNDIPNIKNNYRFEMHRWIDTSRHHAHILDVLKNDCVNGLEKFQATDLGRSIFTDDGIEGKELELYLEVSFEYRKGDTATVYIQTLDDNVAIFYHELDKQLQSILNPFVEPSFIHSKIDGAFGVFGAGIKSKPFEFIYPQDNP
jgi:hypothetical protein